MYRYTANGNYNVREHLDLDVPSVFNKELILDQKNKWNRDEATLPANECRSFFIKLPKCKPTENGKDRICENVGCTWIDDTEECYDDKYGRKICKIKKICQEGGSALTYCKEKGPMCNSSSKAVEDMCCNKKATDYGFINENGNKKKYCAWKEPVVKKKN